MSDDQVEPPTVLAFERDDRVELGWIRRKRGPSHVADILSAVEEALTYGRAVTVTIGEPPPVEHVSTDVVYDVSDIATP